MFRHIRLANKTFQKIQKLKNKIQKIQKLKNYPLKPPNQKSKTYIRGPQIKKFHKTTPPKVGILIQNTISKFSKTKNQTKKRPPKFPKYQ